MPLCGGSTSQSPRSYSTNAAWINTWCRRYMKISISYRFWHKWICIFWAVTTKHVKLNHVQPGASSRNQVKLTILYYCSKKHTVYMLFMFTMHPVRNKSCALDKQFLEVLWSSRCRAKNESTGCRAWRNDLRNASGPHVPWIYHDYFYAISCISKPESCHVLSFLIFCFPLF